MTMTLAALKSDLDAIFSEKNPRSAHQEAGKLLQSLTGNLDFFEDAVLDYVSRPGFSSKSRINPVVGLNLIEGPLYTLVAHCWIPRPDGNCDLSHQSIHHHGKLLLTSLAAFGSGYESILFQKGYVRNGDHCTLMPQKIYRAEKGCLEFIDTFTPHVVFYPQEISVTYALWSQESKDIFLPLKSVLKPWKVPLKKALSAMGLSSRIGLNEVVDFDFTVQNGKVNLLEKRIMYPAGTQKNFAEAFFFSLQELGFRKRAELSQALHKTKAPAHLLSYCDRFIRGERFENIFEPSQLAIEHVNLPKEELLKCFPGLRA